MTGMALELIALTIALGSVVKGVCDLIRPSNMRMPFPGGSLISAPS